jgi:hypothetical protein
MDILDAVPTGWTRDSISLGASLWHLHSIAMALEEHYFLAFLHESIGSRRAALDIHISTDTDSAFVVSHMGPGDHNEKLKSESSIPRTSALAIVPLLMPCNFRPMSALWLIKRRPFQPTLVYPHT